MYWCCYPHALGDSVSLVCGTDIQVQYLLAGTDPQYSTSYPGSALQVQHIQGKVPSGQVLTARYSICQPVTDLQVQYLPAYC